MHGTFFGLNYDISILYHLIAEWLVSNCFSVNWKSNFYKILSILESLSMLSLFRCRVHPVCHTYHQVCHVYVLFIFWYASYNNPLWWFSTVLCIIMAFCEGGDLTNFLKKKRSIKLTEKVLNEIEHASLYSCLFELYHIAIMKQEVLDYFVQMLLALHFMHERNILYVDVIMYVYFVFPFMKASIFYQLVCKQTSRFKISKCFLEERFS